jgi:hypothetical protein
MNGLLQSRRCRNDRIPLSHTCGRQVERIWCMGRRVNCSPGLGDIVSRDGWEILFREMEDEDGNSEGVPGNVGANE